MADGSGNIATEGMFSIQVGTPHHLSTKVQKDWFGHSAPAWYSCPICSHLLHTQVLEKALAVWNLVVIPLNHPDVHHVKAEPQAESAFICNLQVGWGGMERVGGRLHSRYRGRPALLAAPCRHQREHNDGKCFT